MDDYNLFFIEKASGIVFQGKRITANDFVVVNPETRRKEFLSLSYLRKRFESDERNHQIKQESIRKCKTIFHYV